ncbi:hypothetical protein V5O48_012753 [Marasmius crinis-equi]|uniref:Ribonuclease H1 N-terminal domain-containing protein n=1 Tax=Marasmius crinis-equi TaxID=585013 RepID=A0ABR3F279_9AGAR
MPSQSPLPCVLLSSRAHASIRPPSPVNRETGSYFEGYPVLSTSPVDTPKLFSSCRTDVDRGTTIIKTTVEHHRGWVITTTTKLQRVHPDTWAEYLATAEAELASEGFTTPGGTPQAVLTQLPLGGTLGDPADSVTSHATDDSIDIPLTDHLGSEPDVSDTLSAFSSETSGEVGDPEDPPTDSTHAAASTRPLIPNSATPNLFNGVPDPIAIRRPVDAAGGKKFYVVFVGRQVGIVQDDWPLVRCLVDGVSGGTQQRYKNFDTALLDYYRAWKGVHPNRWVPKYVPTATESRDELAGLDLDFEALEM